MEGFLEDFVRLYGEKRWGLSMYESNTALIRNYINPLIGQKELQSISTLEADRLVQRLLKTAPVDSPVNRHKGSHISTAQVEKIIKLLRCAFGQAVRWEIITKNPFAYTVLPKVEHQKRDIWTADMIRKAIDLGVCKINVNTECQLAFAAATRKYVEEGKDLVGKGFDPRKLLAPGFDAIKATVKEKMELFGSVGKT